MGAPFLSEALLVLTDCQPGLARTYFADAEKRSRADVESSFASLRGTLKSLQVPVVSRDARGLLYYRQASLFQIFNTLVRASPASREAVLQYFSRIVSLNEKRAGMQVNYAGQGVEHVAYVASRWILLQLPVTAL